MNKIKSIIYSLLVLPLFLSGCVDKDNNTAKVVLEVDKLTAEIGETVTFTVKYEGEDVTADAIIKDETNGMNITGNTLKVNNPGEIKFVALYNDEKSEVITVTVTGTPELTLTVDNEVIYVGGEDKATFTVKSGDLDITADAVITNITSGQAMAKGANEFTSTSEGTFKFSAEYNGMVSNNVTVLVAAMPANPLTISADTPRMNADGSDFTAFKVMFMHKDVTAEAKIKNVTENKELSENKFTYSGSLKSVEFEAEYNGKTSNKINVGFGDFYKNVMVLRFTATWCGPCGILSGTLENVYEQYPDRAIQVSVHERGSGSNIDMLAMGQATEIIREFPHSGIPSLYFDFDKSSQISDGGAPASLLISKIKDGERRGADCGITATSSISGSNVVVNATVTAAAQGKYFLGAMLLEDGITGYPQTNAPYEGYVHDNTFRALGTRVTGDNLGELDVNQQASKTYTFSVKTFNQENCRVVLYVLTEKLGKMIATNIISCPIDGFTDYRFEE